MDYATRYPEAVALRNISAKSVAEALFSMISRVGIPKEILTDQGTAFMSRTIRELYELLGIKSIRTSVYHPQTDGLVERFNRTLKTMIRKFVHEDAKNWDKWLEPLLFAVREVPQASTGFSPFELLYGRQPRGVLDVLRETWEEGPSESKNEIQHVLDLRTKLHTLGQLSMENLLQAQDKQSRLYNRGARLRNFTPGDKVLVLLPTSSSKLLAKWQGSFEVTRQVGDLNYEVVRTDRSGARQIYHLNLLKKWNEVEPVMLATVIGSEEDLGPEASPKVPSLTLAPGGDHLAPSQLTDLARLQREFADVFSPRPGRTNLIQHHIETEPGVVVRSRPYRLPEHKKKVVQSELEAMLEMGVIEESRSDWANPIVLVPKTDGSVRFCVDYRKVNAVSKFDAYPMPRVDELLDRLGTARFYSTLDLADPLITFIQRKVSLHDAVWIAPICHASVWVVRGARYLSAPHGQNPPTAHRIRRCLPGWHHHLQSGLAAAHGAPAGGAESAEGSGTNGQPKEVCDWAGGGALSGFPLGSRTGASPNW